MSLRAVERHYEGGREGDANKVGDAIKTKIYLQVAIRVAILGGSSKQTQISTVS